ncbi:ISL3 family transposase [Leptospira santarosai]|uniref:ISL3 family transposase n=2 Tax=Leptospira santarosai TaxID=28183 RepID=UPI0024AF2296|nr:ISL3 family transposase [Leptospira santarosai]MDI7191595.1 ISL3 family transposase [Leptospira santarosai]MDI7212314.1 ISL3 family transposase [Leptospira santarosai]MDI7213347.1 ISL3 family transposase [Leptospira santarosai]
MNPNEKLEIHYSHLLGISSPWSVESVELNVTAKRVDIEVVYDEKEMVECPDCGKQCPRKDHTEKRTWRHLDTMQFQTLIYARIPRVQCKEHGVKNANVPWSEPYSRFTLLFVKFAIDVIKACGTVSDAAHLLNLSWDEIHLIQKKAVERGLSRRKDERIKYLGIDEKSFRKGRKYITVLNDLQRQTVIEVKEGKSKEAADELLSSLSKKVKRSCEAVAVDMDPVFKTAIEENLPDADIVHDKFHISQYLNEALTNVWRDENRRLRRENVETLSGTKFLWITNQENYSEKQKDTFNSLKVDLYKVGKGWQIKEAFKKFWFFSYEGNAERFFKRWYFWATHSKLKPIIKVAKMLKRNLKYILTYFSHRITNAGSESMNSRIQKIKSNARGFRNFQFFRISILFHLGGLNLYP